MTNKIAFERYEYKPFFGSSHHWATSRLNSLTQNSKVLDVGAGSGFLADLLNSLGNYQLHAVEPDLHTAEIIKDKYTIIYNSDQEILDTDFDLIVMMDVLEHTSKPEEIFNLMLSKLKPGGKILLSLPNVAHWSVRLPLLFGFFEYQERGPLDKTHLQLFSIRRFRKLLKSSTNIEICNQDYSIEPIELVLPKFLYGNVIFDLISKLRLSFCRLFPGLMAYQFLAELKKTK